MRKFLMLVGFCTVLSSCGMSDKYGNKVEPCADADCEIVRVRLEDRHFLYRWYYFLTFPFMYHD